MQDKWERVDCLPNRKEFSCSPPAGFCMRHLIEITQDICNSRNPQRAKIWSYERAKERGCALVHRRRQACGRPEVVEQMVRIHTKAEQRKDKTQTSGTAESRSTVDAVYHHQQAFDTY
jgi:hypothetical protein